MNILFIMDDIKHINIKKDSTIAMMWAADERGHSLFYAQAHDLFLQNGKVFVEAQAITVFKPAVLEKGASFYNLSDTQTFALTDFKVVLNRKDPPFDMNYIYLTYLLEQAQRDGVLVANNPQSVRDCNEKLFATQFAHLMVPTLVTSKAHLIRQFITQQQDAIVKPLDGMGGMGVFRLQQGNHNIGSTLELLSQNGTLPIMAQKYIPEITLGDKRILIVNGKPVPFCLARIPAQGETRGNLAAGGTGVAQPLSENDLKLANEIAPVLEQKGLLFVGLDVIGNYITEINVTSPTCIREIDDQCGTHIAVDFIMELEQLV